MPELSVMIHELWDDAVEVWLPSSREVLGADGRRRAQGQSGHPPLGFRRRGAQGLTGPGYGFVKTLSNPASVEDCRRAAVQAASSVKTRTLLKSEPGPPLFT